MSAPTSVTVAGHGRTSFVPRPAGDPHAPSSPEAVRASPRINAEVIRQTPVYAGLLKTWLERSATVPGVADPEWQRLVSYRALMEETEIALNALRPHRAPDVLPSRRPLPVAPGGYGRELTSAYGALRPVAHP
ncbi:hypothetical protein ACFC0M_11180 [Streptomyces sp. NPDC056149]|uniref:hypothetical protein n=1 Tax=unclassified Streptomyces TaxID=2593676 RepID=UPI002381240C|nr:hypothetical protein [Streptomyces sp. WZ-12]